MTDELPDQPPSGASRRGPLQLVRLGRQLPLSVALAALVVTAAVIAAIFPGLLATASPFDASPSGMLAPPSARHWFGTDELGRDIYSRVIYGSGTTIVATLIAVGIGFTGGSLIGLLAGFNGGRLDSALMRFIDVLLAIPGLLL
ncbi:MAG: hypothetical protein LBG11_10170, partial [Bifidobacteriaceae bacterium]|nr:hypothetical protein [Bifidobacteriaceae bacterium]